MMPVLNGDLALKELRSQGNKTPTIMVSTDCRTCTISSAMCSTYFPMGPSWTA